MNKQQSQIGSSHLILIIALAIVILGGLGYVYWLNYMQPKVAENTVSVTDNKKYLSINEWGVKGEYDSSYGVRYEISDSSAAFLLSNADEACSHRILKTISRFSADDVINSYGHLKLDNPNTAEYFYSSNYFGPDLRKVGNYYYQLGQGLTDVCSDSQGYRNVEEERGAILGMEHLFLTLQER